MTHYPFIMLLLAGLANAQTSGSSSVSGTVVNGKTGEPIKGAQVTVTQSTGAPPARRKNQESVGMTLADGSFRLTGLAEGSFYIRAMKPGFAFQPSELPASRSLLKAGETLGDTRLSLTPLGILSGRVTNREGDGVASARVFLLKKSIDDGRRAIRVVRNVVADDRGAFRLWNLEPGTYYLEACSVAAGRYLYAEGYLNSYRDREAFTPVFAGGANRIADASPLTIETGVDLSVDIAVTMHPAYEVQGSYTNFTPGGATKIDLVREGETLPHTRYSFNSASGRFALQDVLPGAYSIRVTQGTAARGEVPLVVGEGDVKGVTVPLARTVEIPVHVSALNSAIERFRDTPPEVRPELENRGARENLQNLEPNCSVRLIDVESQPWAIFENRIGTPQSKAITGVFPGEYAVRLECPMGYVVSGNWGETDLLSTARVTVREGVQRPIEISTKYGGGTLAAFVTDVNARPQTFTGGEVGGSGVLLIPQGASMPGPIARFITLEGFDIPDPAAPAGGPKKYVAYFNNLAPGDYQAYAFSDLASIEYGDPQILRGLTSGVAVHIDEGDKEIEIEKVTR